MGGSGAGGEICRSWWFMHQIRLSFKTISLEISSYSPVHLTRAIHAGQLRRII